MNTKYDTKKFILILLMMGFISGFCNDANPNLNLKKDYYEIFHQTEDMEDIIGGKVDKDVYNGVSFFAIEEANGSTLCSGSFVSPNTFLTASHCVCNAKKEAIRFPLLEGNGKSMEIKSIIFNQDHECNDKKLENDVAFIIFKEDVSEFYHKVSRKPLKKKTKVQFVGYGRTHKGMYEQIDLKRRVGENILIKGPNKEIYTISSENGMSSFWFGDSGGPMLSEGNISGVIAGSIKHDTGILINFFANISNESNTKFFNDAVENHGAKIIYSE